MNPAHAYRPGTADEATLRLLGPVDGKRVLELGCGAGDAAIALARRGAKVIALDESAEQLAAARDAADREGVRLELHQAPLAELAFVTADSVDAVHSAYALGVVEDVARVFRQVHRVLRPERPLVISHPHPAFALVDPGADEPRIQRSWWDSSPVGWATAPDGSPGRARTITELFTALTRANFRVDQLLEPKPDRAASGEQWVDAMTLLPPTLIIRARKEGI
jgi:SAM-dependent methyltransferase